MATKKTKRKKADKYLGSLCYRGHDYEGTGKSLRYQGGACVECRLATDKRKYRNYSERRNDALYKGKLCKRNHRHLDTFLSIRLLETGECFACKEEGHEKIDTYDPQREGVKIGAYILGSLCPKKHDFHNTGSTLRYAKSRTCVLCARDRNTTLREQDEEGIKRKNRLSSKRYRERHPEEYKKNSREGVKRYYERNRTKILEKRKLRYQEEKETIKAANKQKKETFSETIETKKRKKKKKQAKPPGFISLKDQIRLGMIR